MSEDATDALTPKEKETLRLILRGHDAKSSARALDLSVHTVNGRLRDARRKLGVTSSKEAARLLLADEGPEFLAGESLGDASADGAGAGTDASNGARPGRYRVVTFRTDFSGKPDAVETVTLEREGGAWRVVS